MESLRQNAVFQLSLSSKELFHSNFINWMTIDESTRELFKDIWGFEFNPEKHIALREYNNFDFCICNILRYKKDGVDVEEPGEVLLIIENKFKSIPYKKQLDEYRGKVEGKNGINEEVAKRRKKIELDQLNNKKKEAEQKLYDYKSSHKNFRTKDGRNEEEYINLQNAVNRARKDYVEKKEELPFKDVETKYFLLTLAESFLDKDKINEENVWTIKTYCQYAQQIKDYNVINGFAGELLAKYAEFVLTICNYVNQRFSASKEQIEQMEWEALISDHEKLKSLRIDDIWQKLFISKVAEYLKKQIEYNIRDYEVTTEFLGTGIYSDNRNLIVVGSSYSNGCAILEVSLHRANAEYTYVVQIQSGQYRHCVCFKNIDNTDREARIKALPSEIKGKFEENSFPVNIFADTDLYPSDSKFNKYTESFLYRYKKINNDKTVKDIVCAIINDIKEAL